MQIFDKLGLVEVWNRETSQDKVFEERTCSGFCEKGCTRLPDVAGDAVDMANVLD